MMNKKFNILVNSYELYSQESSRTIKWIVQYNETMDYFRANITFLNTDEVNELSRKAGHLRAMIEKYAKYLK